MPVLGEKVKDDCHVSFPNSEIFSYRPSVIRNTFEFEFFFYFIRRTTKADLEDHWSSADHSLRNAVLEYTVYVTPRWCPWDLLRSV